MGQSDALGKCCTDTLDKALFSGKRIDIWTPSTREAMRFGRRTVKLTILSLGGKKRSAHSSR